MKNRYTLSLDDEIVRRARKVAGLIPFSRYIEDLLRHQLVEKTTRYCADKGPDYKNENSIETEGGTDRGN